MDKKGLEDIYVKTKSAYPKSFEKYQKWMKENLPEKDCSKEPSDSTRSLLFDYLYGNLQHILKESDRKDILDFFNIMDCIKSTEYALGLWRGSNPIYTISRLTDSKPVCIKGEDIVITDPCYFYDYGEPDSSLIKHSTIYGDWSCAVRNKDTGEDIGNFCADAGMVGIFLLKNVKNLPKYSTIEESPHIAAIIPNFTGTVTIKVGFNEESWNYFCYVEGEGSVNFETYQNGY